ncbi:MAG TPA: biotin/lipoyl-containing protein, partial [Hanamia sp.]|nr:biotin/lipoyl-containing protein [Hanamia sp.]
MAIDIKVPTIGESISEVTLTKWLKKDGEWVDRDAVIAELESEKATFEINAEKAGMLHTLAKEDDTIKIGDVVATIDDTAQKPANKEVPKEEKKTEQAKPESKPQESKPAAEAPKEVKKETKEVKATPVAAAILADKKVDVSKVIPSGSHGKIMKNDVLDALANPGRAIGKELFSREESPKKMSNLRRT